MEGICPGKGLVEGHLELESPGEASGTSDLYPLTNHPWVGGESSKVGGGWKWGNQKGQRRGGETPRGLAETKYQHRALPQCWVQAGLWTS